MVEKEERSQVRRNKSQVWGSQKTEDTQARNVRKVANRCVFSLIRGSGMAGLLLEVQISKNGTLLWHKTHLQLKMLKNWRSPAKNGTPLWKHICKSKFKKIDRFGPLFEVQMSKNCTPLWRKWKCEHPRFGTLLELPMWKRCPTEEIDRLILNQSCN